MSSDDRVVPPPPPESLPPLPPAYAPPPAPPATQPPYGAGSVPPPYEPAPAPRAATTVSTPVRVLLIVLLAVLTISTAVLLYLLPMLASGDSGALPVATASAEPPSAEPPAAPGSGSTADGTAGQLEATIAEYKQARSSGELWQRIPDTAFNRTAVTAFLFFLTDMKLAAGFGIDDETAQEYATEAAELERRLLAEEPLGSDIHIDLGEGKVFEYDGDTGEGGWVGE